MRRFETRVQTSWDIRAAGNFIFAGCGSALLFVGAVQALQGRMSLPATFVALGLMAMGLFCVWLEIGRPWRAINVLFHPHTSWMTREASVAMLTFVLAIAAVYTGSRILLIACGLAGLLFLFCQGMILYASKAIPAWRESAIVPLIILTGLCEAMAMFLAVSGTGAVASTGTIVALIVLLVARFFSWSRYLARLRSQWMPQGLDLRLGRNSRILLMVGTLLPVGLLLISAMAISGAGDGMGRGSLLMIAAAAALLAGWYTKWNLITKASHVQGFALASKVQIRRGRPKLRPPVVRGGYR